MSSAAVARSWGEKLVAWISNTFDTNLSTPNDINLYGGALQFACVLVMLRGVNLSKMTINVFTVAKVGLVIFLIVAGLLLFNGENLRPFSPSGFPGIFRGATMSFFAYLGYDEVCCLGGEAIDPHHTVRACSGYPVFKRFLEMDLKNFLKSDLYFT